MSRFNRLRCLKALALVALLVVMIIGIMDACFKATSNNGAVNGQSGEDQALTPAYVDKMRFTLD